MTLKIKIWLPVDNLFIICSPFNDFSNYKNVNTYEYTYLFQQCIYLSLRWCIVHINMVRISKTTAEIIGTQVSEKT